MWTVDDLCKKLNANRHQINSVIRKLGLEPSDKCGNVRLFDQARVNLIEERLRDVRVLAETGILNHRLASVGDMAQLIGCPVSRIEYHMRCLLDGYRRQLDLHDSDPDHVQRPECCAVRYLRPFGQDESWPLSMAWDVRARIRAAGDDEFVIQRELLALTLQSDKQRFLTWQELLADDAPPDLQERYTIQRTELRESAKRAVARAAADKDD